MHATLEHMTIWSLISDATPLVKGVMLTLLLASLASWYLIVQRSLLLGRSERLLKQFQQQFRASADLAQRLNLPIILTVGLRLGCINHALLTQEAISRRGLTLAGWVANVIDPDMPEQAGNLGTLQQQLQAPLLAHWAWAPEAASQTLALRLPQA